MDIQQIISTKIRTRYRKHSWMAIVLFLVIFTTQMSSEHINFDDVETSWLKNVAVYILPKNKNQSSNYLKITGLSSVDIEDGVQIKPTFSSENCIGNQTDLQIIDIDKHPTNSINIDLIVSLSNFKFQHHNTAYLCIKTKYDQHFQHMGHKSEFTK